MSSVLDLKNSVAQKTKGEIVTDSDYKLRVKDENDAKNTVIIQDASKYEVELLKMKAEGREGIEAVKLQLKAELLAELQADLKATKGAK